MKYLKTLPLRLIMIPAFYVVLMSAAIALPFVCLFGTIKYKGKKYL